ncbi:hypothetical protein C8R45DRAFT_300503 [Mycena sanguinolenta]|nr:hypothetical protein C8R45DRAFT_300503 [Mycena sanguinolenta]
MSKLVGGSVHPDSSYRTGGPGISFMCWRVIHPNDFYSSFDSADVLNCTLWATMKSYALGWTWLSQANHIFTRLNIASNFEKYVYLSNIDFEIKISGSTDNRPTGYLFVCSAKDLQIGASSFRWSACPAYWSLDPSGVDPLSTVEARRLGFPCIEFEISVCKRSWDANVYAGLRRFYRAKGFDPDSQDVARHLGYPLYQVSPHVVADEDYVSEEYHLTEEYSIHDHIRPSKTFEWIMNVQLGIMLFLAICWLHALLVH